MRLTARRVGDALEVEVRDTGVGIADADQTRIFEAFQRGGRDARTSTEGTGLGLTLSKRFVELHGGRMWMESELGAGSRFWLRDPRDDAGRGSRRCGHAASGAGAGTAARELGPR